MSVQIPAGNIAGALSVWAQRMPLAPAVIDGAQIVSYRGLEAAMLRAAAGFAQKGWAPGSVIGVALAKAPAALHIAAMLALARIGIVQLLLSPDEVASGDAAALLRRHRAGALLTDLALPENTGIPIVGLDAALLDPLAPVPQAAAQAAGGDLPWLLARSSGTTGKPKEFRLTHAMELARYVSKPAEAKFAPGERTMTLVNLGFTMGLRWVLWCLFDGGTVVAKPRKAGAASISEAIDRHNVASLLCTPSHYSSRHGVI